MLSFSEFLEAHKTKQNYELQVGTNYVGHFLLTYLLLDMIRSSAPGKIVNVSSCRNYACVSSLFFLDEQTTKTSKTFVPDTASRFR